MKEKLEQQAGVYVKRNTRKKIWHKVVTAMAAVVVFCTTYALILPAITLENTPTCGIEEHQHGESCYRIPEEILACPVSGHSHGPECTDERGYVICGNPEYLVHTHDDLCYGQSGELICTLAETAIHEHTEDCYEIPETEPVQTEPGLLPEAHIHDENCYTEIPGALICTEEEKEGHIHSDETECYIYEQTLVCGAEETEGHLHTESCYDSEGSLVCAIAETPAHFHEEACYQMTATLVCSTEESLGHTHGEGCYGEPQQELTCEKSEVPETVPEETSEQIPEPVLICGYGSYTVHQHTQDCFAAEPEAEPVLICEKEEHIHDDLRCYADLTADLETEADWVKTFPELSGYWMEDILAIADSQVGYHESTSNYIVDEEGVVKGYTRYGEWFGYPHGDWCAMFTSFCLHYAGVPEEMVPHESSCRRWIELLESEELDLFRPVPEQTAEADEPETPTEAEENGEGYTPVPGDLVFFDLNGDGISDHVGVVEWLENGILHTIEGNRKNSVQRMEYELTDPVLVGYGMIPEQPEELLPEEPAAPTEEILPTEENTPTEEPDPTEQSGPTQESSSAEQTTEPTEPEQTTEPTEPEQTTEPTEPEQTTEPTEPPVILTEQTVRAVIYTDAALLQEAEDETVILITGLLPEGAVARAYPVVLEENLIAGETVLLAYDITIVDAQGHPVAQGETNNTFTVRIQPPGWAPSEGESYHIYHISGEGEPTIVDSESREAEVTFTTDHFSTYVLTSSASSDEDSPPDPTEGTEGTGFTVTAKWVDDEESLRPASVTVQLYQNGEAFGELAELTAENQWTHTWNDLPEGFEYTAREIDIPAGYYSADDGGLNAEGVWEITNTGIPDCSVSAQVLWPDDVPGADSVTVSLLAGGVQIQEAVLSADTVWYYSWDNLPKLNERGGEIVYTVEEAPPKGYSSTAEAAAPTENTGDCHYVITNTRLQASLTFHFAKYAVGAADNPTLLAGAQLELYRVCDDGEQTVPGTEQAGTLLDSWLSENGYETVEGYETGNGIHTLELDSGTYYLFETRTPSGHVGLSGPVVFTVNAEDGTVELIECPYELTLEPNPEVEFPVYNHVTYVLPETGGMGTGLYTIGGWLLILAAAMLLILSRLKRGRGAYPYT